MGAGFLQDLNNQGATQAPTYTMPTYQGGGYTTTQGDNFNYTTPDAPYAGMYTAPVNINAPRTAPLTAPTQARSSLSPYYGSFYSIGGGNSTSSPQKAKQTNESFNNPSPLPNYSMYIAPEQMPNINAYLQNPNSLLGAMQSSGMPSAGAGRFSNLLSTNTSKGK